MFWLSLPMVDSNGIQGGSGVVSLGVGRLGSWDIAKGGVAAEEGLLRNRGGLRSCSETKR